MSDASAAAPAAPAAPTAAPATTTATPPPAAAKGAPAPAQSGAPAASTMTATADTKVGSDPSVADLLDLKANGEKYVEVTIDGKQERWKLVDAIKNAQRASASGKRFEQAVAKEKAVEDRESRIDRLIGALEDERHAPEVLIKIMGRERYLKHAQEMLAEEARRAALPEHERARLEVQEERARVEQDRRKLEEQRTRTEQQEQERQTNERAKAARPQIEAAFADALKAHGMEGDPYARERLRLACTDYIAQTGKPLTKSVLAQLAEGIGKHWTAERTTLSQQLTKKELETLAGLDGDALLAKLEEYLPGATEKIRKADLARIKGNAAQQKAAETPRAQNGQFQAPVPPGVKSRKKWSEIFK